MKLSFGVTAANMNYRHKAGDMEERVKVTAKTDDIEHDYYFKGPGGWTAIIVDYLELVRMAYPGSEVTWEFVDD